MPFAASSPPGLYSLSDQQLDALLAHPHWESLGADLDALVSQLPSTAEVCERTTILTWIYQQRGVMSFLELTERLTGYGSVTARKRQLRYMLRGLEKLLLVQIVNFPPAAQAGGGSDDDGVIGRSSVVSLTWSGMVWMRRAWQARANLAGQQSLELVHSSLVAEEDEGKANEPYWVENLTCVDPDGPVRRADRIAAALPALRSVFDLARGG